MSISIKNPQLIVPTLVIMSLFLAGCSLTPTTTSTASPSLSPLSVASPSPAASAAVINGSLTTDAAGTVTDKTVHYNNPAGGDDVRFAIKVDPQGTIIDAQAEVLATHDTSMMMQTNFANALKGAVVGKKVAGLKVDRVGGASLTTGAFNKFLSELKT